MPGARCFKYSRCACIGFDVSAVCELSLGMCFACCYLHATMPACISPCAVRKQFAGHVLCPLPPARAYACPSVTLSAVHKHVSRICFHGAHSYVRACICFCESANLQYCLHGLLMLAVHMRHNGGQCGTKAACNRTQAMQPLAQSAILAFRPALGSTVYVCCVRVWCLLLGCVACICPDLGA